MAAPCLLLHGDGNAFPDGERGTLHFQLTSRLHRCRRTDRLMDGSRSTVQHGNGRHPLRSEPPRRPVDVVVAPAVGLRATAAMPFFRPYTRVGSGRPAAMDGPNGPVLQKRGAGALLLLPGKFAVPAATRCSGTLAPRRRIRFDSCRAAGPGGRPRGRRSWERLPAGWKTGATSCETSG